MTPEQELLGACYQDPDLVVHCADHIDTADFLDGAHRHYWEALVEIYSAGKPMTVYTLAETLKSKGLSAKAQRVSEWADSAHAYRIDGIIEQIHERRARVLMRETARRVIDATEACASVGEVARIMESGADQALSHMRGRKRRGPQSIGQVLSDSEQARTTGEGAMTLLETGWHEFDQQFGGLPLGTATIVAARPSVGKTAFCQSLSLQLARRGVPVFYDLLEDTRRTMRNRLLSMVSGLSSREIGRLYGRQWTGPQADDAWADLQEHREAMRGLPLYIDDSPGQQAETISVRMRDMVRRHKVQVVFVDHALEIRGTADPRHRVDHALATLRDTASELGIAVVVLAQMRRYDKEGAANRPRIWHLKESGKFDELGRLIIILHRPHRYAEDKVQLEAARQPHGMMVHVDKCSEGKTGKMALIYEPQRTLVREPGRDEIALEARAAAGMI